MINAFVNDRNRPYRCPVKIAETVKIVDFYFFLHYRQ